MRTRIDSRVTSQAEDPIMVLARMVLARVVIGISVIAAAIFGWMMLRTWKPVQRAEADPRHRRRILLIYLVSAVIVAVVLRGRPPKNQKMLVAYTQGDSFYPPIRAKTSGYNRSVECRMASDTSIPPDQRGDVLLCGAQTQLAWDQTWLRGDIKSQIYENATILNVTFHGTGHGHGAGRSRGPSWTCKRLSEGIDCE